MWSLRQSLSQYSVVKLLPENPNISQLFGTGKDYSDGFFTGVYNLDGCGPDWVCHHSSAEFVDSDCIL